MRGEKLWFNHLLNELHWDMSKRLEGDGVAIPTVGFRTTLMAVTLLRLTVSALPLEQRPTPWRNHPVWFKSRRQGRRQFRRVGTASSQGAAHPFDEGARVRWARACVRARVMM